jgi:4'-phosphopantetheinyl transferase
VLAAGHKIDMARREDHRFGSCLSRQSPAEYIALTLHQAREALALISQEEQQNVTRKYHIADARMSLGSALLKRLFVHRTLGMPWKDIRFGRKRDPVHGKPIALLVPPQHGPAPIEFNISHQAGLVVLVGCKTEDLDAEVGVDIVCVNERNDYKVVDEEGFDGWVDIYSDIFSQEESFDMKYNADPFPLLDGTIITHDILGRHDRCCARNQHLNITLPNGEEREVDSDLLIDAKLRRFYTFWCYKEAYIKLDGEALLAEWIPQLEFKHVRAPRPGTPARCSTQGSWGERVSDAEVWFSKKGDGKGPAGVQDMKAGESKRLRGTRVEIQAFEEDFMIGVAAKEKRDAAVDDARSKLPEVLTHFVGLHLEEDIMGAARKA